MKSAGSCSSLLSGRVRNPHRRAAFAADVALPKLGGAADLGTGANALQPLLVRQF